MNQPRVEMSQNDGTIFFVHEEYFATENQIQFNALLRYSEEFLGSWLPKIQIFYTKFLCMINQIEQSSSGK